MSSSVAPVAILSAIPPEVARLRHALIDATESDLVGRWAASGRLDGMEVVVAEAGIGKVNAAVATALLVERFGVDFIVFTGVAGGLDPGLTIGDVVIGERTVQHDAGVLEESGLNVYQSGHLPFFDPTERFGYEPPPYLLDRVRARLDGLALPALSVEAGGGGHPPRIVFGTIATGDQFVNSETHRRRLHSELAAAAVEMEGAALAQSADAMGIDHLVIRSLSDLAGAASISDFGRFVDEVAANSERVVRHLLPVLRP